MDELRELVRLSMSSSTTTSTALGHHHGCDDEQQDEHDDEQQEHDDEHGVIIMDADFEQAIVLAQAPGPQQHFARRSWLLMQHARSAKQLRGVKRQLEAASARADRAETMVSTVREAYPVVARTLRLGSRRTQGMDEQRCRLVQTLALRPQVRGEAAVEKAQARAVAHVAHTALAAQAVHIRSRVLRPAPDADAVLDGGGPLLVNSIAWQWDETAQKVQNILTTLRPGERRGTAKVAVQTMMQGGRSQCLDIRRGELLFDELLVAKALYLQEQTGRFLLEGFLRQYPLKLEDHDELQQAGDACSVLLLTFSHDRASANFKVVEWVFTMLCSQDAPDNIWAHSEACVLHGLHLVRHHPSIGQKLLAGACSFTVFLRHWRSMDAWKRSIIQFVEGRLRVVIGPPPREVTERNLDLRAALFHESDDQYLWKFRKGENGELERIKSSLLVDMEALMDLIELGHPHGHLVHYCPGHGGQTDDDLGDDQFAGACCRTRAESVDKVLAPILNLFCVKAWAHAMTSRWTHTSIALKRIACGFLIAGMFATTLNDLQIGWGIADTIEAFLAAQIMADSENFEARRHLRLKRICQAFCTRDAAWQLAIVLAGLRVVDSMMYRVFGREGGTRTTFLKLIGHRNPNFAKMQSSLLALLDNFDFDCCEWALLSVMGGDCNSDTQRRWARCFLLQMSASLVDHFEIKWSGPPHSLLPITETGVPLDVKRERIAEFMQVPMHCLCLFGRRLRRRCPTEASMLGEGSAIIHAWACNTMLGIDACERAHATLRVDLRSTGPAKNATVSANRVLCKAVAAEHERRFGVGSLGALPLRDGAAAPREPSNNHKGGNSRFVFNNLKMAVFKQTHAPDRPLTEKEVELCRAQRTQEWESMSAEERAQFDNIHRAAVLDRSGAQCLVVQHQQAQQHQDGAGDGEVSRGKNVWGGNGGKNSLLPVDSLMEQYRSTTHTEREKRASNDTSLLVTAPVLDRFANLPVRPDAKVVPCWHKKKNICRASLEPEVASWLDELTTRLNKWFDSLSKENRRDCSSLLLLRAEGDFGHGAGTVDMIALLISGRLKPKVQMFGRCCPPSEDLCFSMPNLPAVVRLAIRPGRLCGDERSVDICTSDELGMAMYAVHPGHWRLFDLDWKEVPASASLLDMVVTGVRGEFIPPQCRGRAQVAADDVCRMLDMLDGDPMVMGRSIGRARRGEDHAFLASPPAGGEDINDDLDAVDNDHLPADLAEDVVDCMAVDLGIADGDDRELAEAIAHAVADAGGEVGEASDSEAERAAEEAAATTTGAEPDGAPTASATSHAGTSCDPWATHKSALRQFVVAADGRITCPVYPWSEFQVLGRITTWPERQPLEKRSVSIKCGMHTKCFPPARKRAHISDAQLLAWLAAGTPEPHCTAGRDAELAAAHKRSFASVIDGEHPLSPSGAASSSGG